MFLLLHLLVCLRIYRLSFFSRFCLSLISLVLIFVLSFFSRFLSLLFLCFFLFSLPLSFFPSLLLFASLSHTHSFLPFYLITMRRLSRSLSSLPPSLSLRCRHFSRWATPSRTAPTEAPSVIFKPQRPVYSSITSNVPFPTPPDPQETVKTYWPEGFVPNLVKPLPWIVSPAAVTSPVEWSSSSVRCGGLGRKLGMMAVWDARGIRYPLTVLEIDSQVVRVNTSMQKGKLGLVMGIGRSKLKKVSKALMVESKKAGVFPSATLHEFRCTPDALLPVTHSLSARHFTVGQFVDVTATSSGFGFAGAMQRWNFAGQPASHGVSLTHRSHGATGSRQDPGRVFKGKKMAGRMGGDRITTLNLKVYRIDPVRNLVFVHGAVPGRQGAIVRIRDAIKKKFDAEAPPPFPTFIGEPGTEMITMESRPSPSSDCWFAAHSRW